LRTFLRSGLFHAALLAAALQVPTAKAQNPEPAQAASPESEEAARLFEEGTRLYDQGKVEAACQKFEASLAKKPGIGTRFQLANCFERIGRAASARALFLEVAEQTRVLGQTERERLALERALLLEPQLTRLVINKQAPEPGLTLQFDGKLAPKESWHRPIELDPGEYEVAASAPGKQPWATKFRVRAGEAGTIRLEIPALKDQPAALARVTAPAETAPAERPPASQPPAEAGPNPTRRSFSLVLAGTGALALLTGAAFGAQSVASHQDAESICPANGECTPGERDLKTQMVENANRARNFAFVGVGVGASALIGAGYLYFADPARLEQPRIARLRAAPLLLPSEGVYGAALSGGF
jgi:hypothetical protein